MTAPRFQTGRRHQTSPASLPGVGVGGGGEGDRKWTPKQTGWIELRHNWANGRKALRLWGWILWQVCVSYVPFTCMPGHSHRRRFRSALLCPLLCVWRLSSAIDSLSLFQERPAGVDYEFSRQLSAFSSCSCGLISALLVLSTTYLYESPPQSWYNFFCGRLGLKHQLTNYLPRQVCE